MKLNILRQEVLDDLKSNLDSNYQYYFSQSNNQWIIEKYGEDAFITFKDVPEFSLIDLSSGKTPGEVDLENCKTMYSSLKFLTESQACDERLWAGLAHSTFYDFMRRRWKYDVNTPYEKAIGEIRTRFFFNKSIRSGLYRSSLARLWWIGKAFYDGTKEKPFESLDILGPRDFTSKISDILYSNNFASNPEILNGIIKGYQYFNDEGVVVNSREHMRPTMQLLNAIGGGIVLDYLTSDEICDIFVQNIEGIMQGDEKTFEIFQDEDTDEYETEETDNIIQEDVALRVSPGQSVHIRDMETNKESDISIDADKNNLNMISKALLGKKIGDIIELEGTGLRVEIIDIFLSE